MLKIHHGNILIADLYQYSINPFFIQFRNHAKIKHNFFNKHSLKKLSI